MTFDAQSLRLEKVLSFSNGRSSPARDEKDNISVYGSNGLIGYAAEANSSKNTIVIGRVGSYCGSVHFSKNSCWVTDNAIKATAKDDNDPFFLYYVLKHLNLNNWRSGSGQPLLNQATLNAIEALIPPPSAQRLISKLLCAIDDRITLLRETNSTLEAIAQALFKSWFVDFDPVRARAEGRLSEGIDDATAALFPDAFEEAELGLVPSSWHVGCIDDLCDTISNGGTPSRAKQEFWLDGQTPWFKTGELSDGFLLQPSERITKLAIQSSSVKVLPENAVLMAIYAAPTVGRLGVLTEPATFNQACTGMVAKPEVGTWFLYWCLYFGRDWFNSRANGAAQQNISKAIVSNYKIVIPSASVLTAFNTVCEVIHGTIRKNSSQAQTLSNLRDTLLPRLISGQLRIADAETELEKAMA